MPMKKTKRGRKSLGGLRIILRLTPQEVELLRIRHEQTGSSRTELIRRAIDEFYADKRHNDNWRKSPKP